MKSTIKILALFLTLFFIAAKFAFVFDNPEHFLHPDHDCPICQLKDVQYINDSHEVIFDDIHVLEIIDIQPATKTYLDFSNQLDLIRAPPSFFI